MAARAAELGEASLARLLGMLCFSALAAGGGMLTMALLLTAAQTEAKPFGF